MIKLHAFKNLLAFLLRDFTGEYGNFLHFAYGKRKSRTANCIQVFVTIILTGSGETYESLA